MNQGRKIERKENKSIARQKGELGEPKNPWKLTQLHKLRSLSINMGKKDETPLHRFIHMHSISGLQSLPTLVINHNCQILVKNK